MKEKIELSKLEKKKDTEKSLISQKCLTRILVEKQERSALLPESASGPHEIGEKKEPLSLDQLKEEIQCLTNWIKGQCVLEQLQRQAKTPQQIKSFNIMAEQFNELILKRSIAKADAINSMISKYNASQPEELRLQEIQLPQEIKPLKEIHDQSERSSSTRTLMQIIKPLAIGYLALSSPLARADAQPNNVLAQIDGIGPLPGGPRYLDQFAQFSEAQSKKMLPFGGSEYQRLGRRKLNAIPPDAVLVSQTENAKIYGGNKTDPLDIDAAKAIAKNIEPNNAYLAKIFGIKPKGLPFDILVKQGFTHQDNCSSTELFVSADDYLLSPTYLATAQMVKVYEATINNGWQCEMTNGEALSLALAAKLHPDAGVAYLRDDQTSWWAGGTSDYVSTNNASASSDSGTGCGTLFLGYLHDGLGHDWNSIVRAGGNTLAETYSNLTGNDTTTAFPNFKKALQPFFDGRQLIPPDREKSWASQIEARPSKVVSQTDLATVYAVNKTNPIDINAANAVANAIETDHTALANLFGIKLDNLSYNVFVSQPVGGAYHFGCSGTTLFVHADAETSPFYNACEMVEVFEATINNGWDCGKTNGEALSQVLAAKLHPEAGAAYLHGDQNYWWDQGASDYVSTNNATDHNYAGNGCGALFLQYLHDGLGYDWNSIVAAGANTLAETYSKLTGNDTATAFPAFKKALQPFVYGSQLIPPEIERPWDLQAETRPYLISQTDLATVYAGNRTDTTDINAAKAVAQTIGPNHAALSSIFGGIKPQDRPYTVNVTRDTGGAYHSDCSSTTFSVGTDPQGMSSAYAAAVMVEVFEATTNNGWDCGMAKGEALKGVLTGTLHPEFAAAYLPSGQTNWWNQGAHDHVSTNDPIDEASNGCGTLFLGYLHDALGYDWKNIVAAGGNTLAETYSKLTGNDTTTAFPNFKEALQPFVDGGQLIPPDLDKSWASQVQERRQEQRKRKIEDIAADVGYTIGGASGGALAAHHIWRRIRQQRARGGSNPDPQGIALGEADSSTADPV